MTVTSDIPEAAAHLLGAPHFAHVAVVTAAGSVHTTPLWIGMRDGLPAVNTAIGRLLDRRLREDPRVSLSVHNQSDPYNFVQIRGRAHLVEDGAWDHLDELAHAYLQTPYPVDRTGMERVIVVIEPAQVFYRPPPTYDRPRWVATDDPEKGAS